MCVCPCTCYLYVVSVTELDYKYSEHAQLNPKCSKGHDEQRHDPFTWAIYFICRKSNLHLNQTR